MSTAVDDSCGRCPVCASAAGAMTRKCDRCETAYHPDCWDYYQHCAVYGCYVRPPSPPQLLPENEPGTLAGMGEFCATLIGGGVGMVLVTFLVTAGMISLRYLIELTVLITSIFGTGAWR